MAYTVKKLSQLSGVTIRTLHHYDEIGLLKPAYYGSNGYRYYEEEQLLLLQQILFFREMDFDLEQIKRLMKRGDFSKLIALKEHKQVLKSKIGRFRRLVATIDKTIEHLTGEVKMSEEQIYAGFDPQKQAAYEQQLIDRFGDAVKKHFEECKEKTKHWGKKEHKEVWERFASICKRLVEAMKKGLIPESSTVQALIEEHYNWLKNFWTPDSTSYAGHAQLIRDSELRNAYAKHHEKLPDYIAEGIEFFAKKKLS